MVIADRGTVARAVQVGVGGTVETAVGGKTDAWHGEPVPFRASRAVSEANGCMRARNGQACRWTWDGR